MAILAGGIARGNDLTLPDVVAAHGNGLNTVTATAWANLPTTSCIAAITNPHASADMLTMVTFGCWCFADANAVRVSPAISGSITITPGIGGGAAIGHGEYIRATTAYEGRMGGWTVELPPGTATFTMQAYRESAAGTQQVNYPTIRLVPLRYLFA